MRAIHGLFFVSSLIASTAAMAQETGDAIPLWSTDVSPLEGMEILSDLPVAENSLEVKGFTIRKGYSDIACGFTLEAKKVPYARKVSKGRKFELNRNVRPWQGGYFVYANLELVDAQKGTTLKLSCATAASSGAVTDLESLSVGDLRRGFLGQIDFTVIPEIADGKPVEASLSESLEQIDAVQAPPRLALHESAGPSDEDLGRLEVPMEACSCRRICPSANQAI